jgi:hypothetical protein
MCQDTLCLLLCLLVYTIRKIEVSSSSKSRLELISRKTHCTSLFTSLFTLVYTCLHKIFFSFWIILMNNVIILAFCRSKRRLDGLVSHFDVFVFGDIFLRFFFVFWAVKRNFVLFRAALCEILKKTILVLTRFRFLCCLLLLSIYRFWREAKIFSNKWFCVMFYVKSGFHILKSLDYFLFISLY